MTHVNLRTNVYAEHGGVAALTSTSSTDRSTYASLGLLAEHPLMMGSTSAVLKGTVAWRHAFGQMTPESTHAFSAGNAFTVAGAPLSRNSALIEAGLDMRLSDSSTLGLSYNGQLASGFQEHGIKAQISQANYLD